MNQQLNYLSLFISTLFKYPVTLLPSIHKTEQAANCLELNNGSQLQISGYGLLSEIFVNWIKIWTEISKTDDYSHLSEPVLSEPGFGNLNIYYVFDARRCSYLGKVALKFKGVIPQCNFKRIIPIKVNCLLSAVLNSEGAEILQNRSVLIDNFTLQCQTIKKSESKALIYNNSKFKIIKMDQAMDAKLKLNIKLGTLEVSLNDFLQLQEGSEIEVKNLIATEVLAEVGGIGWAQAEVTYSESGARLKIIKLLKTA